MKTRKTVLAPCHAGTGLRQEYETAYPPDRSGSFPSNPLLFIVGKLLFFHHFHDAACVGRS
ncbi:hypothetical protein, partial [Akkermansia muciniphila]|uniref:hypothetical protein n=1 Tax=Akkermansia muciniphila TaxID=239935 RepID=UPI001C52BD08